MVNAASALMAAAKPIDTPQGGGPPPLPPAAVEGLSNHKASSTATVSCDQSLLHHIPAESSLIGHLTGNAPLLRTSANPRNPARNRLAYARAARTTRHFQRGLRVQIQT